MIYLLYDDEVPLSLDVTRLAVNFANYVRENNKFCIL